MPGLHGGALLSAPEIKIKNCLPPRSLHLQSGGSTNLLSSWYPYAPWKGRAENNRTLGERDEWEKPYAGPQNAVCSLLVGSAPLARPRSGIWPRMVPGTTAQHRLPPRLPPLPLSPFPLTLSASGRRSGQRGGA